MGGREKSNSSGTSLRKSLDKFVILSKSWVFREYIQRNSCWPRNPCFPSAFKECVSSSSVRLKNRCFAMDRGYNTIRHLGLLKWLGRGGIGQCPKIGSS